MKTRPKISARRTREQELGDFGEDKALQLLSAKDINVEKMPKNFPFFDLMAKHGARRLLIPVRTRNRFTDKGILKRDNYKLYEKHGHYESASKIETFFGAEIYWVAVTVDTTAKTYSAYMGDVSKLRSPKHIPMHPTRDLPNHDCLASGVFDGAILASWNNIAGTVGG